MKVKMWPRQPREKGGYAMLPLRKNVPEGKPDWELILCPECGRECWKRPVLKQVMDQGMIALCTECALRRGCEMTVN